jgi:hypothetical protein
MGRVLVLPPSQGPVVGEARGATSLGEVGCLAGGWGRAECSGSGASLWTGYGLFRGVGPRYA